MAAATKTKGKTAAKKAPAKKAPVVEVEELETEELETEELDDEVEDADDEELEELEEDEVAESAPAKKGKAKAASQDITFGIQDLVALCIKKTGKQTDPRGLRTLIRKMARDESGRVEREITQGNRSRYNWTGPNDPEVAAIVAAFAGGELEAEKKAKLDKLKADKAAKTAAAKEAGEPLPKKKKKAAEVGPVSKKKKAAPVVEEVEDDEELDFDEDDE